MSALLGLGVLLTLLVLVGLLVWIRFRRTVVDDCPPTMVIDSLPVPTVVPPALPEPIASAYQALDNEQPDSADQLVEASIQVMNDTPLVVSPEQQRAILDSLWTAATSYRYGLGMNNTGQNIESAKAIYRYIIDSPFSDKVMKADALTELDIVDQEFRNKRSYEDFMHRFEQRQMAQNNPPPPPPRAVQILERQGHPPYDFEDLQPVIHPPHRAVSVPTRIDKQNVHDSTLVATMRSGLDKLKESTGQRDVPSDLNDIRRALPIRSKAQNVLDQMMANPVPLSAFGVTESEVLSMVWGRIQDPVNQDRKSDLIESLTKNLEQCYENGHMVCANGRTTHAVQTLEGGDREDVVHLQPKWALDQEVQQTGAHVYQAVLQTCSPDQQHACTVLPEDATPQQLQVQNEVKQMYTDKLKDTLTRNYKDILSPTQIEARVESMAELI